MRPIVMGGTPPGHDGNAVIPVRVETLQPLPLSIGKISVQSN
jgi:hypothetical protein